jgi:hypothetical protein
MGELGELMDVNTPKIRPGPLKRSIPIFSSYFQILHSPSHPSLDSRQLSRTPGQQRGMKRQLLLPWAKTESHDPEHWQEDPGLGVLNLLQRLYLAPVESIKQLFLN